MSCPVLLRAALAVSDSVSQKQFRDELVRWAISSGNEVDIAFPLPKINALQELISIYDLLIVDEAALQQIKSNLMSIYNKNPSCFTIFTHVHPQNICEFLEIRPVGYIGTAGEDGKIRKYASMQVDFLQSSNQIYQISTRDGIRSVTISDILFCQSDLKYVVITTQQGDSYRRLGTLNSLQQELTNDFLRIHQSYLVNKKMICGLDKTNHSLVLQGGTCVPFSKAYTSDVYAFFQKCQYSSQL